MVAALAALAVMFAAAQAAQARAAASLTLNVNFSISGAISVSLPDGTPVGTTGGSPTVIPAGYYQVVELGPGGCTSMPHFSLKGPGVTIFDNLNEGESSTVTTAVYLNPSSTYIWSDDAFPGITHTFVTSSSVVGTAPPNLPSGLSSGSHTTVASSTLVGSNIVAFRGTLTATVNSAGKLTLDLKGKSVTSLKAGRYRISVTDDSKTSGFMLQRNSSGMLTITGVSFVGKHAQNVRLTAGRWSLVTRPGTTAGSIVVG